MRSLRRKPVLALMTLCSFILMNCAGTVTRPLNHQDPVAFASVMKELKSQDEVKIYLRDGGIYPGKVTGIFDDTMDLRTSKAYSKIPASRISSFSYTDHGLGAIRGMYHGFLLVGGIMAGIGIMSGGISEPGFIPITLFVGTVFGALPGLLIGAAGGTTVNYQIQDDGRSLVPEEHLHTKPKTVSDSLSNWLTKDEQGKLPGVETSLGTDFQTAPDATDILKDDTVKTEVVAAPVPDEYVTADQLGRVRIVLKEGPNKKNCLIREISKDGIEYEQDRTLHDLAAAKILRVEFSRDGTGQTAAFEKGRLRLIRAGEK